MSGAPLRILQVITDADRRGAQVFAMNLGVALTDRGHAVQTVALAPGQYDSVLPLPVLGPQRLAISTLRSLRKQAGKVDVVIAHGSSTLPACAIALTGVDTPFVYRQISDNRFWASSAARRARARFFMSRASRIVALADQSRGVLIDYLHIASSRIAIVPNGVPSVGFVGVEQRPRRDVLEGVGLDPNAFTVLYVAALVVEKGADVAIEAVARIPEAQLLVLGDGPERDALERQAATALPGRVAFLGAVDDVAPYLHASDAMVLPSRGGDSMPASLIEAGFCGTVAVSTPIGAITDIVCHGVTGVVVPEADAGMVAEALQQLGTDPDRRARLGEASKVHCLERFEIAVVADLWERVLRKSLS